MVAMPKKYLRDLGKFIVRSIVKFPLCCFFRRQNLAILIKVRPLLTKTHIHTKKWLQIWSQN